MGASPEMETRGTVDGLRVKPRCLGCGRVPQIWVDVAGMISVHAALGPHSTAPNPAGIFLYCRCECGTMVPLSFRDLAVT